MFKTPKSYRDLVYPDQATFALIDSLVTGRHPFPEVGKNGLLVYGPYGTGKTTLADLLPNDFEAQRGNPNGVVPHRFAIRSGGNGPAIMQSIENMTSVIPWGTQHYVILDEVDNLGPGTMTSLKGVMNLPCTVFLMTTNNIHKIDGGVISRCHLVPMTPPPPSQWIPHCLQALQAAGVTQSIAPASLDNVIKGCNGDVRELASQLRIIANRLKAAASTSPPLNTNTP